MEAEFAKIQNSACVNSESLNLLGFYIYRNLIVDTAMGVFGPTGMTRQSSFWKIERRPKNER